MTQQPNTPFGNWRRPPESTGQHSQGANPTNDGEARSALAIPPDSDIQEGAIRTSRLHPGPRPAADNYSPDGTYIPLSGGLRGWYENSGVPASETANRYRFREAVNADAFRNTILERIDVPNQRSAERSVVSLWVKLSDPSQESLQPSLRGYCVELSASGTKLRLRLPIEADQTIVVAFYQHKEDVERGDPAVTMRGVVKYCRSGGRRPDAPPFYAGVRFEEVEIASVEALTRLIASGKALVPVAR